MNEKLQTIINSETNYCKINYEYYIEKYVKIEDRDSLELAIPFTLWQGQKDALKGFINERLNIVLKARQLGLTWLSLAFINHEMIFNKGYQVVALSKKDDDAKELVRRQVFIMRHLPNWLVRHKDEIKNGWNGVTWDSTASSVTIYFPDGEPSVFNSFSASQDSGRSFTANLVLLDEWAFQQWAREIWASAYPTINRPTGGKVIGLSTAKRLTLFEEIWKKATQGVNTFNTIFLSWRTDPRRNEKWYEQTKQDLGELKTMQEYPNTPEEAFMASEGVAFPEFSYRIHVCKHFDIPKHWKRWISADNGYTDPFAWYWYAVDERGQVHIYREYTREEQDEKITYSEQGRYVARHKDDASAIILGHDAWAGHHRDTSGKNLVDYYKDGGLYGNYQVAVTDRALRKATWHEYLKPYLDDNTGKMTAKVIIHDCCPKLIETLQQLLVDEKDNEKVAECSIDHWYDGSGYGLIFHHTNRTIVTHDKKEFYNFEFEKPQGKDYGEEINIV